MKKDIHPTYFEEAKVTCACGNTFVTGSTQEEIHVEICSNCHPFYTGKQKFVDTQRRLDRFQRLIDKKSAMSKTRITGTKKVAAKAGKETQKEK